MTSLQVVWAPQLKILGMPMPLVAGGLAPDPYCLWWLGDLPLHPRNAPPPPPIADFWLRACMKKNNLLYVTPFILIFGFMFSFTNGV